MRFLRLGSAGMRGEIGAGLTTPLIIDFASALGTYLDGGKVVIATDTRFSSNMVRHAVISALLSCGCEVVDAGIAPAPVLHFAIPYIEADGGVLIGAGHHPDGWNAIVPLAANGAYFNAVQQQALLDIYHSRRYRQSRWDDFGEMESTSEKIVEGYLDELCGNLDVDAIRDRNFKVVADFCNGSGALLSERFSDRLGIDMIPINDVDTGVLPHDPEPRPRSSTQVQSLLKPLRADAGFVFNSDMSRAAVVSSTAETLSEEYTFPLVADHVLVESGSGAMVVTNTCTTRTLDDVVAKHKGVLVKTKVGQAQVIDKMLEINADLAGDGSGSVALGSFIPGFDGFMIMGKILECMALRNVTSAELAAALPRYHIVKRKIECQSANAYTLLRGIQNQFPDAELSEDDGIRFDWPDGWVHLRASSTEPVIRMILEWKTKAEAEDRASYIRGLLERLVAE